ncbi:Uncharacterised protein [Vibrio cholerae]|nr:Uncharacterised protein [Vibrio cholerae]
MACLYLVESFLITKSIQDKLNPCPLRLSLPCS